MISTRMFRPRHRQLLQSSALAVLLAFGVAACSSDSNADVSSAVSDAVSDVSNAADTVVSNVSEAADSAIDSPADNTSAEGLAKGLATQVKAKLDGMASPGEPLISSINDATAGIVKDPNKVTGLDDGNNDGKDDDAKFTIETSGGDDKACVQSQNGVWEITDDEC